MCGATGSVQQFSWTSIKGLEEPGTEPLQAVAVDFQLVNPLDDVVVFEVGALL